MTLFYLTVGTLAGVLAGLFGIGGGVIMVIAMVSVKKLPLAEATAISLGAMLLPVGLLGALEYYRRGQVDIRASLLLALGLTVGAWIGARAAHEAPPAMVQRAFAVFLLLMAVRMWTTAG